MREIVLDTETTGLDVKEGHRIKEIGACEMDGYGHFIEPWLEKPTPMSKHDLVENAPFGRLKQTHRR